MFAAFVTAAIALALPTTGPEPARVLVSLNSGGDYQPGDEVRVEVEPDEDGYLVVFRVDGDGYVRVLFPLDPDLDQFVRGGGRYELRGRGERASFLADDRGGTGMIFAALSREPLAFDRHAIGTHWDYERLRLNDPAGDVEAQLLGVVREMSDNGRFDYDAVGYRVWGPGYQAEPTVVVAGGYSDPFYDPAFACLACGWGTTSGIHLSIGNRYGYGYGYGYRSNWYDPWRDDYYYGWNPGYGYTTGWNGWWGWDSWYGTPYRPHTVINVPPRPVVVDSRTGLRSRPRQPTPGTLTGQPGLVGGIGNVTRRTDGTAPRTTTDTRDRARSGGRAIPTRTTGRPATTSTASPPSRTVSPQPANTSPRSRSRGRPDDVSSDSRSASVAGRRAQPEAERPVYRPPTSTSLPVARRAPTTGTSSPRPTSSPPPRGEDSRARPATSTKRTSAPPARSTSIPSRSAPRTSAPPTRSSSIPRSASPPRSTSSSPSRSGSAMPSRGSSPMPRTSSPPRRTSSPPVQRSAPASSGKSSAPTRSRGGRPDS